MHSRASPRKQESIQPRWHTAYVQSCEIRMEIWRSAKTPGPAASFALAFVKQCVKSMRPQMGIEHMLLGRRAARPDSGSVAVELLNQAKCVVARGEGWHHRRFFQRTFQETEVLRAIAAKADNDSCGDGVK